MRDRAVPDQDSGSVKRTLRASALVIVAWGVLLHLSGPGSAVPGVPTAAAAAPHLNVNYAHDWISGTTAPGATVVVVIENESHALKAATTVPADGGGNFVADCGAYPPGLCPNLIPGDTIIVSAAGEEARVEPVGWIEALPDADENTVSGTLAADWLPNPSPVRCEIWEPMAPPPIETTADPAGGAFSCDFDDVGWDLQRGQMVAVIYLEPDGDQVINIVVWPWFRVNSTHDWVGGNYPGGHGVTVTVFEAGADACGEAGGTLKAAAELTTGWGQGWGEDGFNTEPWHWSPEPPDIVPGDVVEFVIPDHDVCEAVHVGDIAAAVDVGADTVSGTVDASWLTGPIQVECHPWGSPDPVSIKTDSVEPNGIATFTCDWSSEWDIMPGQDVGVMYIEPDDQHRVIEVVREPAPHLTVAKWAHGAPAVGGNLMFTIQYQNVGDGPAENVVITDTPEVLVGETPVLGGMSYLDDTAGLPVTIYGDGHFEWDVGTVMPGEAVEFQLYVEVTALVDDVIRNTVHIETTSYDPGPPEEWEAVWEGQVMENDTHVNVGKNAWTNDPAPAGTVIFSIGVCNWGPTGSTEVTLTDAMSAGLTLDDWWANQPGWYEVSSGLSSLTVATLSVPGGTCHEVLVRAIVDPGFTGGEPLSNQAVVSASNDKETEDNESWWYGSVGLPHLNLWANKRLNRGVLVPGGELHYNVTYGNNGNQPVGLIRIVDTLPAGTSLVRSWHSGTLGNFEIVPIINEPGLVVWELADVINGAWGLIEVQLAIDPGLPPGAELTNTVEICGPADPPDPCLPIPGEDTYDDNTAAWTEILNPPGPNLRLIKRSVWQGDDALQYILRFQNIGDQTVPDVTLADTLPEDTFWDGWWTLDFPWERLAGDVVYDTGVLTWNFNEIHPGENGRVRFNAVLDGTQEHLQWIVNSAAITVPLGDPTPDDNFDTTMDMWGNQCFGNDVTLFEETYSEGFWCQAPGSITANSVTVTGSGQVTLRSPLVTLGNDFAVEAGGTLWIGTP